MLETTNVFECQKAKWCLFRWQSQTQNAPPSNFFAWDFSWLELTYHPEHQEGGGEGSRHQQDPLDWYKKLITSSGKNKSPVSSHYILNTTWNAEKPPRRKFLLLLRVYSFAAVTCLPNRCPAMLGTGTQTHRQQGDLIFILFSKQGE
jgi:hypothetical protein